MSAVSTPRGRAARSRATAALLAVALTGAMTGAAVFAGAAPAYAHDQLLTSSPAANEQVAETPAEVAVEFTDDVMDIGTVLLLTDTAGTAWELGAPVLAGALVTASIETALPDGGYTLAWRVVSADGHPISGVIPFTVGDTATAQPGVTNSAPGEKSAESTTGDATPDATQNPDAAGAPDGMPPLLRTLLLGAGGAALALGLARVVVLWRRRRTRG